jgi:hypothetical protein
MSAASKHPGLRNSPRFRVFVITFAAVYAVAYYIALRNNWPVFSYGPAVGEWTLFNHSASDGPRMYWYGWIATSAIVAAVLGLIAAFLPQGLGRKLWSCLAWAVPVCMIAAIMYLLSGYFTH